MANYYDVVIKSEKMTQKVASEILQEIGATKKQIRWFNFNEGYLAYNTRGLLDISNILEKNGFTEENATVEIIDEGNIPEEKLLTADEAVIKDLEEVVQHIEHFKKYNEISEKMKNIENILIDIIKEK